MTKSAKKSATRAIREKKCRLGRWRILGSWPLTLPKERRREVWEGNSVFTDGEVLLCRWLIADTGIKGKATAASHRPLP